MSRFNHLDLSARDSDILTRLEQAGAGVGVANVRAAESWPVRVIVLLLAPIWGLMIMLAMLVRVVRWRLPVVALHDRVGFERRRLVVPKVATMSLPGNRRLLGGLVEHAAGSPEYPTVERGPEAWLRHSGLDELPQLVLVVTGQMRIIGPRPVTFEELDEVGGGESGTRLAVDELYPGILGVWQVLDRHSYTLEQRCELDIFMVDNWSPALRRRVIWIAARQAARRFVSSTTPSPAPALPVTSAGR